MKKRTHLLVLALAVLLVLAGCISMKEEFTINPDNSAKVIEDYGYGAEFSKYMDQLGSPGSGTPVPVSNTNPFEDTFKEWENDTNVSDFKTRTYDEKDRKHFVAEFTVKDFAAFVQKREETSSSSSSTNTGAQQTYSLVKLDNGNYRYTQSINTDEQSASGMALMASSFEGYNYDLIIHVPSLVSTNGKKVGNTASWSVPMKDLLTSKTPTSFTVEYSPKAAPAGFSLPSFGGDGGSNWTYIAGIVGVLCCCLVVIIIIVVVIIVVRRRRKNQ